MYIHIYTYCHAYRMVYLYADLQAAHLLLRAQPVAAWPQTGAPWGSPPAE